MSKKSSVVRCFSNPVVKVSVIVDRKLWTSLWSSTFGMILSGKKNITATEVVLTQLLSYNVVSKYKNKNENTEYHGMFISFKSHLYSKQGSLIFLLFRSWSLALYLLVWVRSNSFSNNSNLIIVVDVQRLHENGKLILFLTGLNGWGFIYEISGCGIDSCCSYLNFQYRTCFK